MPINGTVGSVIANKTLKGASQSAIMDAMANAGQEAKKAEGSGAKSAKSAKTSNKR